MPTEAEQAWLLGDASDTLASIHGHRTLELGGHLMPLSPRVPSLAGLAASLSVLSTGCYIPSEHGSTTAT